jgi:hypothetical protein
MRAELATRIGPWRSAFDLYVAPSADWLARALDAGATVEVLETLTVVTVPSGARRRSYTDASDADDDLYVSLVGPDGRAVAERLAPEAPPWTRRAMRRCWRVGAPALTRLGVHPFLVRYRFRHLVAGVTTGHVRRGDFIGRLRSTRGLPRTPTPSRRHTAG